MAQTIENLKQALNFVQSQISQSPKIGLVLGSGLGPFVEKVQDKTIIPYKDIPHFHTTSVEGHEGRLIVGKIEKTPVAILQGRLHAYEGLPMEDVVFPVRLLAMLGIESLILTNAAGGINSNFRPGDLVCITDHINLMGKNPLVGPNIGQFGPRFPDMTHTYNPLLIELFEKAAKELGQQLKRGVYAGMLGPTYETPAEVKMLGKLGADMVGMSTVPEAIAAHHLGVKICGLSCITNMAAGIIDVKLKHEDIKEQAMKVMESFSQLLCKMFSAL